MSDPNEPDDFVDKADGEILDDGDPDVEAGMDRLRELRISEDQIVDIRPNQFGPGRV